MSPEPSRTSGPDASLVALGLAAANAVAYFALRLPHHAANVCFQQIDATTLAHYAAAPPPLLGLRWVPHATVSLLVPLVGTEPAAWVWAIVPFHVLNAALLWLVARTVGLPPRGAAVAGLLLLGAPIAVSSTDLEFLVELQLLSAWLGLVALHIRRARATTRRARAGLLVGELAVTLVGLGAKESFVVYPLLLVALELTGLVGRGEEPGWARLRRFALRLAPQLLLWAVLLPRLSGAIADTGLRGFALDAIPQRALARLTYHVGAVGAPFSERLEAIALPGVLVLVALAASCLWLPGRRPAVRLGVVLSVVTALPVLVIPERVFPAYSLHPAAGVLLAIAALSCLPRPRLVPIAVCAWMLAVYGFGVSTGLREAARDCVPPPTLTGGGPLSAPGARGEAHRDPWPDGSRQQQPAGDDRPGPP